MTNPEWLQKQIGKTQLESWHDVLKLWMNRIKRPLTGLIPSPVDDRGLMEEFEKCYTSDLFNPDDPIGSYMALDCVSQVPEEFFSRNDKYGMSYGMEGRFPMATKKFMKYCMDIHSSIKMGENKSQTKILSKKVYQGMLPDVIINKQKTGWTVPIGSWLTSSVDTNLNKFYIDRTRNTDTSASKWSTKSSKNLVPTWQVHEWAKKYQMEFK